MKKTPLTYQLLSFGLNFETKNDIKAINVNFYIYLVWAENHLIVSHYDGKKFIDLKLKRIYYFEDLERWFRVNIDTTEYKLSLTAIKHQ